MDEELAEAEGAGKEVRVVNGDPQLLLVQLLKGYYVAPVYLTHVCPVVLATYLFLLQLPVLPSIRSACPSRTEPLIHTPRELIDRARSHTLQRTALLKWESVPSMP